MLTYIYMINHSNMTSLIRYTC